MIYDLVFTGEDRQLYISSSDGEAPRALTMDLAANPLMMWGQPQLQKTSWSWPCWSPDGAKIGPVPGKPGAAQVGLGKHVLRQLDRRARIVPLPGQIADQRATEAVEEGIEVHSPPIVSSRTDPTRILPTLR